MVRYAKEAGVWACKVQHFYADDLAEGWEHEAGRLRGLELTDHQLMEFMKICQELSITPMTSTYSVKHLVGLQDRGFKFIKIGSAQCADKDLIDAYIKKGFKVIVSTGGA